MEIFDIIERKEVIGIIITKFDFDEKPEEMTILTYNKAEKINLKLYHTIFTSTEEIWNKVLNIYEEYKINCEMS